METTTIALGTAAVVVLLLLMSCWDPKPTAPSRRCRNKVVVVNGGEGPNLNVRSNWGTGRQNRSRMKRYNQLANVQQYDDWNSMAQYQSLEDSVYASHNEYVDDLARVTSGASMQTVRSDDQYPNPWMGLRRPNMHDAYSGTDARVVSSEFVDQMPYKSNYLL